MQNAGDSFISLRKVSLRPLNVKVPHLLLILLSHKQIQQLLCSVTSLGLNPQRRQNNALDRKPDFFLKTYNPYTRQGIKIGLRSLEEN